LVKTFTLGITRQEKARRSGFPECRAVGGYPRRLCQVAPGTFKAEAAI